MNTIINVTGLGKAYKKYSSRWQRLIEWIDPRAKPYHQLHWVLNDLNFSINAGESVGIVGINGAGKSTLLKMLVGTAQPTIGNIKVSGRIAALLELGMGFHPEFTGRQNAIMAGQLLGLTTEEVCKLMPEIERFSEIGNYIDLPVRVYSSGMQMRLAFSVATATRPDILIVDEALSVGDAYFQHKSFERIREFKKKGTTLIIVSHDKDAIQTICDRAILLNSGKLLLEGKPDVVMDYYNALLAEKKDNNLEQLGDETAGIQTLSGSRAAIVKDIYLKDENNKVIEIAEVGQIVSLRLLVKKNAPIEDLVAGFVIKDRLGQPVYGTNTFHLGREIENNDSDEFYIDFNFPLNIGTGCYSISVALHSGQNHINNNYYWKDRALMFDVVNKNKQEFVGVAWLDTNVGVHHE